MHMLPASIAQALAIDPPAGSTWRDAAHVVFLMQENRSFDHTYGTLQGVRGFNDPRAITLPDNNKVWLQTNAAGETYAPFHLDIRNTRATWMNSLPHSWSNQVDARNNGKYDHWLQAKASGNPAYKHMPLTLGYHTREDIPFYYALADAFTVCDHNFCSSLTGTTPNRLYFWSGTIREKMMENVLARVWNGDADYENWANWTTFPERLEDLGVPWKVYQNDISVGVGFEGEEDSWLANFTDNPLEFVEQYNVKLSPSYINNLPKDEAKLKGQIAAQETALAAATGDEATKITRRLDQLKRWLAANQADQKKYTLERFQQLPARDKSLHEKAFSTNKLDPHYHELATLQYKDGDTKRTVQLPKGDILHQFRKDVNEGTLPMVSWIVAPENFSDHPGAAWYGAWYLSEVMDILTKNPEVWKKTILVLTYDENDGYFDHVPPFVPPHPTKKETGLVTDNIPTGVEYVMPNKTQQSSSEKDMRESPIGLGYRVPLVIASPWTRGGYVNSEIFDHTSSLQFLEQFLTHKLGKPVTEPNITEWRRTICGDLTSVFRPYNGEKISTPAPVARDPFIQSIHNAKFKPLPANFKRLTKEEIQLANTNPAAADFMPKQEKGIRSANALAYDLNAEASLHPDKKTVGVYLSAGNTRFRKTSLGAPFQVYTPGLFKGEKMRVRDYTVDAGTALRDEWALDQFENGQYHLQVYGPNGFFREFKGDAKSPQINIDAAYQEATVNRYPLENVLLLHMEHAGKTPLTVVITDNAYRQATKTITVQGGPQKKSLRIDLAASHGWYDFTVTLKGYPGYSRTYAGHVETGKDSKTDPHMGGLV